MDSSSTLSRDLRHAVAEGRLTVHYQPIFDLTEHAPVPQHPAAVEALCRWTHPRLGAIFPDTFIPLAEEAGLIAAIGAEVLAQAGAQVSAWQRQGYRLGLSVNASPSQFSPEFVAQLATRAAELGLEPGSLTIEITEAPAPQLLPPVVEVLPQLRAAGIAISIDDYGAGDVSLEVLETVAVAEVKIDRSLTQRSDAAAEAEIADVVERAARNGWRVVAEGIETLTDLERSRRRGCRFGQGYLLGRPMPAADLGRMLAGSPAG